MLKASTGKLLQIVDLWNLLVRNKSDDIHCLNIGLGTLRDWI